MASFAGPTGGGYLKTAGHSAIWSAKSTLLTRARAEPSEMARAILERGPARDAIDRPALDT